MKLRPIKDEAGGEVMEYALISGLIVVAALAVITSAGGKVLGRWNSIDSREIVIREADGNLSP